MVEESNTVSAFLALPKAINMASAVAVLPSYIEALAMGRPVRADIMLWYSKM